MFEFLPGSEGKVMGIHATGHLHESDCKEFMPKIEQRIDELGRIKLLVDMEGLLAGIWTPPGMISLLA